MTEDCRTPGQRLADLQAAGAFETEEFGFAIECAYQYGFEIDDRDDSGDTLYVHVRDLYNLMTALGYSRRKE